MLFMLPGDAGNAGWPCQLRWVAMIVILFVYAGNAAYEFWLCWPDNLSGYAEYSGWIVLLATLVC